MDTIRKNKGFTITGILVLAMLVFGIFQTPEHPTPPSPMPEALATTGLPVITLSTSGQIYDCGGKSVGGLKIRADNITVRNCNIYASTDYSFEVRADGLMVDNVEVYNNRTEGSIFDFALPDGSCVSDTSISNIYADGDVGWGFTGRICGLTLENSEFYRIGKKSSSGKHFFYLNNSTGITLNNVYIEDVWNSCFKIVGNVSFIYLNGVTCKNIGTSNSYGSGVMIGEGGDSARQTDAHHLFLNGFTVINAMDGAIVIDDGRKPVYEVVVNGVYYPTLKPMKTLPPVQNVTATSTNTPTKAVAPTNTPSRTPTRTPTITPTRTASATGTPTKTVTPSPLPPSPIPTFCETAQSEHFHFQGCGQLIP